MGTASNYSVIGPYGTTGLKTSITTTASTATAFGGVGGTVVFDAIGCNVFVKFGNSAVGAAVVSAGNFDAVIPSGTSRAIKIPDSYTHFTAITDLGTGTLYTGRSGY